jgi:transposase
MLHHDNAPCHTAISVIEFLAKKGIPVVPQPPYSPDLSPCDFFLFPKLKFHLKGVTDQLKAIPISDFQREWEQRLRRFVVSQGTYSEGDKLDL